MKILRRILVIILCIAIIFISAGYLLPGKVIVSRSLSINASQRNIFEQINTLKNWAKWSPWLQTDTAMQLIFLGPESGIGAAYKWQSQNKNVGTGNVAIIGSVPYDSLMAIMDFGKKGKSLAKFRLINENHNTNITWSLESDLGMNPITRWFGLFSDEMIGPDLDRGLYQLGELMQELKTRNGFEIIEYEVPARIYLTARDTASPATVSLKLASMYEKISVFLKANHISPAGAPIAVFHNYSNQNFDIEACLPISSDIKVPDGLNYVKKDIQKAIMVKYFGYYKNIALAYNALNSYILENGLKIAGPPWEEYISNPSLESDSSKLQTNIYFPVN